MLFMRWSAGKPMFVLVVMESLLCHFAGRARVCSRSAPGLARLSGLHFRPSLPMTDERSCERIVLVAARDTFPRPRVFSDFCMNNYTRRKGVFSGRVRNGGREGNMQSNQWHVQPPRAAVHFDAPDPISLIKCMCAE